MVERWRSLLFVPGDRPDRFAKAETGGADLAIVDLEDGVARSAVAAARANVRAWLDGPRPEGGARRAVRVSAVDTADHDADVACLLGGVLPDVVILPKAESRAAVETFAARLGAAPGHRFVLAGIESVIGVLAAGEILAATPVVACYFGAEDYVADLGGVRTEEGTEVLAARSLVAMYAKVNGVVAADQIVTRIDALERLGRDCELGRSLGYQGKICIHPSQVAVANRVFGGGDKLAWAERVLAEAAVQVGVGVFTVDGQMIDEPLLIQARTIVAAAGAGGAGTK